MEASSVTLQLRLTHPRYFARLMAALLAFLCGFTWFGIHYFGTELLGLGDPAAAVTAETGNDTQLKISLWLLILSPWLLVPAFWLSRHQRLVVDATGIRFSSNMGLLGTLRPDWTVHWPELAKAHWCYHRGQPYASQLTLTTRANKHTLVPWQWVACGSDPDRLFPDSGARPDQVRGDLNNTPLVEALAHHRDDLAMTIPAPGVTLRGDGEPSGDMTVSTIGIAGIFMAMIMLFIIETYFTAKEFYAEGSPFGLLLTIALIGMIVAYLVLQRVEPERKDSLIYALLFGFGLGLGGHALVARVNIWTDTQGLAEYEYRLGDDRVWHVVSGQAPSLDVYLHGSEWWRQFEPGARYSFQLRRGGLGIWLVNMQPVYAAQKAFYNR